MCTHITSTWLKHIVLISSFLVSASTVVSAQSPEGGGPPLERMLSADTTVWITEAGRREQKARIVSLSAGAVTTKIDGEIRRVRASDISRIRVRQSDSLLNGALIGAGAAVAGGLLFCRTMEPWQNCRDDYGPMLRIGAVGAAIGLGIDAAIRGRRTIYEAGEGSARLEAVPLMDRRAGGLQLVLRF